MFLGHHAIVCCSGAVALHCWAGSCPPLQRASTALAIIPAAPPLPRKTLLGVCLSGAPPAPQTSGSWMQNGIERMSNCRKSIAIAHEIYLVMATGTNAQVIFSRKAPWQQSFLILPAIFQSQSLDIIRLGAFTQLYSAATSVGCLVLFSRPNAPTTFRAYGGWQSSSSSRQTTLLQQDPSVDQLPC